jgi:hypothetical protein
MYLESVQSSTLCEQRNHLLDYCDGEMKEIVFFFFVRSFIEFTGSTKHEKHNKVMSRSL